MKAMLVVGRGGTRRLAIAAAALCLTPNGARPRAPQGERPAQVQVQREMPIDIGRAHVSLVEPFLAVHPTDRRRRAGAAIELAAQGWTVVAFSTADGGVSWERRELPRLAEVQTAADPWLFWSRRGTLYLSLLAFVPGTPDTRVAVWLYESQDGGRSWSAPIQLPWTERGSYDHAIIAADPESGARSPLYVVATYGLSGLAVLRSARGRDGFQKPLVYLPDELNNNLGGAVTLRDGRLVFTYFDMSTPGERRPLWAVRTSDRAGGFERHLVRRGVVPWGFPTLAVDQSDLPTSERLYAAWVESAEEQGLDVMLSRSSDGGVTWAGPVRVNTDRTPTFRGRPFVAVNRAGVVGVTWNDRRHGTSGACSDVYFAASLDGGGSFLPEVRVSSATACHPADLDRRWAMGGDYSNLAATSDGHFHVVWADARTGVYALYTAELAVTR